MSKRHVVVIGAGVTGLTSAIFLAESGYVVTVVAAQLPGDERVEYASPWAGAHWNASATPSEPMLCDWEVQTYEYWLRLLEREEHDAGLSKSGLKMQDSYHFYNASPTQALWWAPHVQSFRQLPPMQEPLFSLTQRALTRGLPKAVWGAGLRAPSINVPRYLLYLKERARSLGAEVFKTDLPVDAGLEKALIATEDAVAAKGRGGVDCFVNATGLGARKLCSDEAMHPIRGQTVLVKGEAIATRTMTGANYTYCIPRPGSGTTILGGVKEKGNWNAEVDAETTRKILEVNSILAPELLTGADGGFEVISVQCGFRPGREGGPRLERESVGARRVVHAYGHGGAGYQQSVGSARLVVRLVTKSTGGSHVFSKL